MAAIAIVAVFATLAGAAAEDTRTVPDLIVDTSEAEMMPDGTLAVPKGEEIVLAGLDVALGLAPASKAYLRELRALQREHGPWRLVGAQRDRHGRLAGRVETKAGDWVQERMLRLGLARFAGGVPDKDQRTALLMAEQAARAERRGIWRNPRYFVRPAGDPDSIYNGFQIVEGHVRDIGRSDGTVFLNFGEDWRVDFTAGVTARLQPDALPKTAEGVSLSIYDLDGRMVRLRGVVRRYNGPFMEIVSADQIELLPNAEADPVTFRSANPSDLPHDPGSTL
ncbi:thermonuclease family protein [Hwanghaeella grinnelliae]|uniref:thermonuclease family protein n=1 Tax=Hwanghaeella grinnelliae TaxID=2500179 RepID=UPI00138675CF|nr:thermonuclease family protein [Hwanghaeella grinnelliae]